MHGGSNVESKASSQEPWVVDLGESVEAFFLLVGVGVLFWLIGQAEDRHRTTRIRFPVQSPPKGELETRAGQHGDPREWPPPEVDISIKRNSPTTRSEPHISRATPTSASPSTSSDFTVSSSGFQPTDRCSCGGTWVKMENSLNGGRFFSCSQYPNCTNTRDKLIRERLGSRYRDFYCSRGHELAVFGTTTDPQTGREICDRCIEKGYVNLQRPTQRYSSPLTEKTKNLQRPAIPPSNQTDICKNGHPRTYENTYVRPDGSRECRICRKLARK